MFVPVLNCFFPVIEPGANSSATGGAVDGNNDDDGNLLGREMLRSILTTK